MESLSGRWLCLGVRLSMGAAAESIGRKLWDHYSEPHRAYHNLDHLAFCLTGLDEVRPQGLGSDTVELALWFHDVIYDPRSKENEAESALFFRRETKDLGWRREFVEKVEHLILVTRKHEAGDDPEERLISDIDLAILGQDREAFGRYEDQIRSEYSWVDAETYRQGRSAVLRRFLERPSLYFTDFFRSRCEERARQNLQESLRRLDSSFQ